MADTSSITTNYFIKGDEAYAATLSSSIGAGATTVPVTASVAGDYVDDDIAALTVEPGTSDQATFVGRKSGTDWVDIVWTEGNTAVGHTSGDTVIDYDSATHQSALVKGLLTVFHQNAHFKATKQYDTNDNEVVEWGTVAAAVNQLKVTNAATGTGPILEPSGGDTDVDLTVQGKGTGTVIITSLAPRYKNAAKTTTYPITANDHTIRGDATSAGFTVTLPTAASVAGKRYTIIKTDTTANVLTVATTSSQTIDGITSLTMLGIYCTVTLESDGSNWIIVAAASQMGSYTPTWSAASGTAPAVGNGTLTGRYRKVARRIEFQLKLTAGGTTTFGNGGQWRFTLPENPSSTAYSTDESAKIAIGNAVDTGTALTAAAGMWIGSATNLLYVYFNTATTGAIIATQPHAWATTDVLFLEGSYETAT